MNDNISIDYVMDMLAKWEWLTVSIARYLIAHNIDPETIPEMMEAV